MIAARITVLTATVPDSVSKTYRVTKDGKVHKQTVADVSRGRLHVHQVRDLEDFADILKSLKHNNALIYGIPPRPEVELVTSRKWVEAGRPAGQVARTKEAFNWPMGRGIMMLDYDPPAGQTALSRDELLAAVRNACPALADCDLLWFPSASSHIVNTATGETVTGLKGQRLYIMVEDATDIPRAGAALAAHLWAAGFGRYDVSAAGTLLERTLVDTSVWQTNRIDFAAGAVCVRPLAQQRGEPVLLRGELLETCDTATAIPDPDAATLERINAAKNTARMSVEHVANETREQWKTKHAHELAARLVREHRLTPEQAQTRARETVDRVLDRRELYGDWTVQVQSRDGEWCHVTVGELLDAPYVWHGCLTLDPLEPDYDGGRPVGKLFLIGARPNLHSMAHGGQSFRLSRQLERVELTQGRYVEATNSLLETMRRTPHLFDYGPELVSPVGGGKLKTVNKDTMQHVIGSVTQFYRRRRNNDGVIVERLENPPEQICKTVLAMRESRQLKPLDAVINAPLMRPDGTVQTEAGYDADVRLLLDMDEAPPDVPDEPNADELREAFATLWEPFAAFPFVSPVDRGVALAACLTAIQRPVLGACPAFAFDAPRQGTGKSLLAESIGVLATGERPASWPHIERNEEEIRKRLLTALRNSTRVMLWDNILGQFDSAAVATLLTQSHYQDRLLGSNTSETYPNKALVMLTGNNFQPAGELPRRILTCRLDAKTETPFARTFDFVPTDLVKGRRMEMVRAGLTLLRGYVCAGRPRLTPHRLGSFEQWDDMIRQAVLWVAANVAEPDFIGDPMTVVLEQTASDPALEILGDVLHGLADVFGGRWFTASEVANICQQAMSPSLSTDVRRALAGAVGDMVNSGRNAPNVRRIGMTFTYHRDKPVGGLVLQRSANARKRVYDWRVVRTDGEPIPEPGPRPDVDGFDDLSSN